MEAVSVESFDAETKSQIFRTLGLAEEQWQDPGGFESFVFAHSAFKQILRITHKSHRNIDDLSSKLEFLQCLKQGGAAVCSPLSSSGNWLTEVGEFTCSLFEMAPGRLIQQDDWLPQLFQSWWASIGRFHRLTREFEPTGPGRFDWQEDENLNFRSRIPNDQEDLLKIGDSYLDQLRELPINDQNYGLIHSDAHAGNFFLDREQLHFFDFDDCCYQWFAFDVATILFSAVLQPWMPDEQIDREVEANKFLPEFLEGYQREYEVSDFLIEKLPLFLKVREFSLYAVIHSHMDVTNLTDWYPTNFMAGRQARLEQDLPYLNLP